jgi:hypothetical protein
MRWLNMAAQSFVNSGLSKSEKLRGRTSLSRGKGVNYNTRRRGGARDSFRLHIPSDISKVTVWTMHELVTSEAINNNYSQ